jgi:MFS family permease
MITNYSSRQVSLTAIVLAISVMGDSMLYGVLPSHITDFGLTAGIGVGLILSVNRWVRLVSNSWAAIVYNRFGIRVPLFLSIGLAIATTAAYSLFHGFWPLLISRIFWGICFSIQIVSLYMVVLREAPEQRGRLMGLYNAIFRSGSLVAVLIGGALVDILGIDIAFLIVAVAMLCCIPIVMLIAEDETHSMGNMADTEVNHRFNIWTLILGTNIENITLRSKILAVNYTRFTHTFAVSGLVTSTIGLLLKQRIGESLSINDLTLGIATITGIVLSISWSGEVISSNYFGQISDRFGRRPVILLCVPVMAIGLLSLIINNSFMPILVVPIIFLATTAGKITLDASAGDLSPHADKAHVMSRYSTWADLGAASGPIAGYGLMGMLGLHWIYIISSLLIASGVIAYVVTTGGTTTNE